MVSQREIDKYVAAMNRNVKRENKILKFRYKMGQIFGGLIVLFSVIDTLPDLARETFTLARNSPDILGILGGGLIFLASKYLSNDVANNDEERRRSDLDIALNKLYGEFSSTPEEPLDSSGFNLN